MIGFGRSLSAVIASRNANVRAGRTVRHYSGAWWYTDKVGAEKGPFLSEEAAKSAAEKE